MNHIQQKDALFARQKNLPYQPTSRGKLDKAGFSAEQISLTVFLLLPLKQCLEKALFQYDNEIETMKNKNQSGLKR